jgi:DNA (cytosine-5)-methyltransferase 1
MMRALDLFSGAGGATCGLQQAGFHVTGVDLKPQPNYCGDLFVQADALDYLKGVDLSRFDFIWASPPCQAYTSLRHAPGRHRNADLIGPTRELLIRSGLPWVIENVEGARDQLRDPVMLCGT